MKNYLRLGRNPKTGATLILAKKKYMENAGGLAAHMTSTEYLLRQGRNPKTGAKLQVAARKVEYSDIDILSKIQDVNEAESEIGLENVEKTFTVNSDVLSKIQDINEDENDFLAEAIRPGRNPKTGQPLMAK